MPSAELPDPWPRLREVVTAVVSALRSGRFIEEGLEALVSGACGATSAWSTLETKSGGADAPVADDQFSGRRARSPRPTCDRNPRPGAGELRTVAGYVPYATTGSFAGIPLWGDLSAAKRREEPGRRDVPRVPGRAGDTKKTSSSSSNASRELLGGIIAQQSTIESTQEDLRVERARDHHEHYLELEELLAPKAWAGFETTSSGRWAATRRS